MIRKRRSKVNDDGINSMLHSELKPLKLKKKIYNERGELVEIHEKFPVDKGHRPSKGNI